MILEQNFNNSRDLHIDPACQRRRGRKVPSGRRLI